MSINGISKVIHSIISHLIAYVFGWLSLGYVAGKRGIDFPYVDYMVDYAANITGEQALIPAILSIITAITSIIHLTMGKAKKDKDIVRENVGMGNKG